jgi:Arrestin (or S-antigen), C-terminal domain
VRKPFQYSNLSLPSGDIIPLELSIKHFEPFTREKGIKVELIRIALFGKSKNQTPVQNALRSLVTDLNVSTNNFVFSATPYIMIPTSTPPTIDINGKILNVQYQVRISINLNPSNGTASKSNNVVLEIPIVVATWPPAAIPIDLDLEGEELELDSQSEGTESDPEGGETEQKPSDVPKQVFVAPRTVRTSSLSQSDRPPPIIPLSSQMSGAEIATAAATTVAGLTFKDNNNINRGDGAYPNHIPDSVSSDNVVGIHGVDSTIISTNVGDGVKNSTLRTASHRFPMPTVSSLYETSSAPTSFSPKGPPQPIPHESFSRSHSLPHSHHSVMPAVQPSSSQNSGLSLSHSNSINSGTSANSSHYSPNISMPQTQSSSHGYHSTIPTSQMLSPPGLHSAMSAPHSPSSSLDHYPAMPMPHNSSSSYPVSTHYGHTPSISLPQMPIPNHHNRNECHYLPYHSQQKPFLHGYGNQTNAGYQMPDGANYSQADYTPENAYYPTHSQAMPSYQSNSYYPQLHSESDPAYAPFTYPMSLPTPSQVMPSAQPMPTPNAPYYQSQFPFS